MWIRQDVRRVFNVCTFQTYYDHQTSRKWRCTFFINRRKNVGVHPDNHGPIPAGRGTRGIRTELDMVMVVGTFGSPLVFR